MAKNKLAMRSALLTALILTLLPIAFTIAATPTFTAEATVDKPAYYIGESVSIDFTLEWQFLTQNYTVDIELWNETAKIATLESGKLIDGAINANGTYTTTYTRTDLTGEPGTTEYTVKVIDTGSLLTVAQDTFQIVVQERSIYMSISWDDSSGDRKIDEAESVTFTAYITWTFANASETLSLKVKDQGVEKLIDTLSITAGSGSAQKTYITSFESAGTYVLTFWLEDADGEQVISKSISVTVGQPEQARQVSWTEQIYNVIYENRYIVIVFLALLVCALVLIKFR
jgi:hypothetical protein